MVSPVWASILQVLMKVFLDDTQTEAETKRDGTWESTGLLHPFGVFRLNSD